MQAYNVLCRHCWRAKQELSHLLLWVPRQGKRRVGTVSTYIYLKIYQPWCKDETISIQWLWVLFLDLKMDT